MRHSFHFHIHNLSQGEKGFIGVYLTIVVLMLMLGIITSIGFGVVIQQRMILNTTQSAQAYYAAESGAEDALLRVATEKNFVEGTPYMFAVSNAMAEIVISPVVISARTITAKGSAVNRVRRIEAIYQIDSDQVSFNFGAHVGAGGLVMDHGQGKIIGNVFANGNISGDGTIMNSAVAAGSGNSISGVTVNEDAQAYSCSGATIGQDLEYNVLGSNSCSVGGLTTTTSTPIDPIPFAITPQMILDWKAVAEAGGIIDGGGSVIISVDRTLGPGKITGNLTINNGNVLTLTGTVWVTGTLSVENNATVELDPSYGNFSGSIVADDTVWMKPGVALQGTASPSSFLLVIGNSFGSTEANPAIDVKNNAIGAILFAPNGVIVLHNNTNLVEVLAYKLLVKKATVTYDLGLANVNFTTGPSGGWAVTSWKEIP